MIATVGKRQIVVPTGCEMGIVEFIGEQVDAGVDNCLAIMATAWEPAGQRASDETSATITRLICDGWLDYDSRTERVWWRR